MEHHRAENVLHCTGNKIVKESDYRTEPGIFLINILEELYTIYK